MKTIPITGDYIKLEQLLKLADVVSGGGEAKVRIQWGEVSVNGQVETRRGRKLHPGDEILFQGLTFRVAAGGPEE